jgi:hypothetical protein
LFYFCFNSPSNPPCELSAFLRCCWCRVDRQPTVRAERILLSCGRTTLRTIFGSHGNTFNRFSYARRES